MTADILEVTRQLLGQDVLGDFYLCAVFIQVRLQGPWQGVVATEPGRGSLKPQAPVTATPLDSSS